MWYTDCDGYNGPPTIQPHAPVDSGELASTLSNICRLHPATWDMVMLDLRSCSSSFFLPSDSIRAAAILVCDRWLIVLQLLCVRTSLTTPALTRSSDEETLAIYGIMEWVLRS